MDSALMPSADASPSCSAFTQSIAVRPAGSGLCLERIVVVSLPEPWPKPALGHALLKPAAAALTASATSSRLFAAVPWADEPTVEVYERQAAGNGYQRFAWTFDGADELHAIVTALAGQPLGEIDAVNDSGATPVDAPTLLLCTQGSHDVCCGRLGNELAAVVAEQRPDVTLRRVSHTGGHRFAPTLLALPSGRMWAWADLELIDRIAAGEETADDFASMCRGSLTVTKGSAQVAELAARIHWGSEPDEPFTVVPIPAASESLSIASPTTQWLVRGADTETSGGELAVQVRPGREIPTIACESPGGLPVKVTADYQWKIGDDAWT